jgi:hypothetical protein
VNIGTFRAFDKKGRVGFDGNVLDVDVMSAMLAEALQNAVGFLRGFQRIRQFHLPTGEIIFLNINEEQGGFH